MLYTVAVTVHVAANLAAFGVIFAWPLLPAGTAAVHRARARILGALITRVATVALAAGLYLATAGEHWGRVWVWIPFAIFILLLGVIGAFLTPKERALAALLEAGEQSAYDTLVRRVDRVAAGLAIAVVVAVAVMVMKPTI